MTLLFGIKNTSKTHFSNEELEALKPSPEYKHHKIIHHKHTLFGIMWTDTFAKDTRIIEQQDAIIILNGYISNPEDFDISIYEAYKKWGINLLDHIHGSYQLIIYEKASDDLYMAITPYSCWQMMYGQDHETFYFSNFFPAFKTVFPKRFTPNMKKFAERLLYYTEDAQHTFFNEMECIPTGHYLRHQYNKHEVRQFWHPKKPRKSSSHSFEEHVKKVQKSMTETIEKIISRYPKMVGSDLSGGLDSSFISGIAANLLKKQNKRLPVFTAMFPNTSLPAFGTKSIDDSELVLDIAKMHGNIDIHWVDENDNPLKLNELGTLCYKEIGGPEVNAEITNWRLARISKVKEAKTNVLLIGSGGNITFSRSDRGPTFRALASKLKHTSKELIKYKLSKRNRLKKLTLISELALKELRPKSSACMLGKQRTKLTNDLNNGLQNYTDGLKICSYYQIKNNLRYFDPFCDLNFIKVIYQIPAKYFYHRKTPRAIARNALKQYSPPSIYLSTKRGLQNPNSLHELIALQEAYKAKVKSFKKCAILNRLVNTKKIDTYIDELGNLKTTKKNCSQQLDKYIHMLFRTLHYCDYLFEIRDENQTG